MRGSSLVCSIALILIVQFGTAVVPIVFDIELAIVFVLSVRLFLTVDDVDGATSSLVWPTR